MNTEKSLLENKSHFYFDILNGFADAIRILNENNQVIFVNDSMLMLMGANVGAMYCTFDNPFCNLDVTAKSLETGAVIERESDIDGRTYLIKTSPIRNDFSDIVGVVEIFRDISREKRLNRELKNQNIQLIDEMQRAEKIQEAILPEKGFYKNLKLSYVYEPESQLSGDMIDVFEIDEDNVGVYISDTVGHGFSASMVTMSVSQAFRNMDLKRLLNPNLALKDLCHRFTSLGLGIEIYLTCFYAVLNVKTGQISYSNAGHAPCPLLFSDNEVKVLESSGFPISPFFENVDYSVNKAKFFTGDKILFMTDGCVDGLSPSREPYSLKRVMSLVPALKGNIIEQLFSDIRNYINTVQIDDMTLMLMECF